MTEATVVCNLLDEASMKALSYARGIDVATVTVSPKYQVVIPREVREAAKIKPGSKVDILYYNGRIHFIPIRPLSELRGSLRGMDTNIEREEDRPL